MTLPELFAEAMGLRCEGPHRCCYCGAPAADPYTLPDSFTTRDTLRRPGSPFACRGCLLCLEEVGTATYHTGERYEWTKAFRRMCSWVVTADRVIAATKAHVEYLRGVCLNPPAPPFGISLAVSGQKHVLYRGVVCRSADAVSVTLEGERVDYRPAELQARLALCGKLVAATGKPALAEHPSSSFWFRVCGRYSDGEAMCVAWSESWQSPLSRLAAFLSPKKEDAEREHPGDRHGGVPAAGRGPDRPDPADRRRRRGEREGGGEATLFDLV